MAKERDKATLKLFTKKGVPVRVCKRLAKAVDTKSEATTGYDPNFRVQRKVDMYKIDFREALNVFGKNELQSLPVVESIERRKVGVPSLGTLTVFQRMVEITSRLRRGLSSEKAAHRTKAILALFGLSESSPVNKLELFRFVRRWAVRFVPFELLGNKKNFGRFVDNLKCLIGAGKSSAIPVWRLVDGINTDTILWLHASELSDVSLPQKQQALAKVVVWLAQDVFWRLLLSFFHVTDMSGRRHELFFYRKRHFQSLFDRSLHGFLEGGFLRPLSLNKAMDVSGREGAPAEAKARLFPKASGGCRLLAVKGKEESEREAEARTLLALLKDRHPEVVDSKGRALHRVWAKFAGKIATANEEKVFFVRVDIKNAFDSVRLEKLSEILLRIATEESSNTMHVHTVRYREPGGRVVTTRRLSSQRARKYPCPEGCQPLPLVSRPIEARSLLKSVARRSRLHTVTFRIGRRSAGAGKILRFLKIRGLVQGDSLSMALCDLYYGDMVRRELWPAMVAATALKGDAERKRLFVRGVDDFVFASTDRGEAETFLSLMEKGFPNYGCNIRKEKTVTNLRNATASEFAFCGALLGADSLQARPDYGSYFGKSIVHSLKLNLKSCASAESFILQKMLFTSSLKVTPLYLDGNYNGRSVALANLFESFHLLALRFAALVDSIFQHPSFSSPSSNGPKNGMFQFVSRVVEECRKKVLRRLRTADVLASGCQVSGKEACFLFYRAFLGVALRRAPVYGSHCIGWLRKKSAIAMFQDLEVREDLKKTLKILQYRGTVAISGNGYKKLV